MRKLSLLSVLTLAIACGEKDLDDTAGELDADADGYPESEDCDDLNADINPEADEICDGVDNDCSGEVDDNPTDGLTYYVDADGDGRGDENDAGTDYCEQLSGYVLTSDDCDDTNAEINNSAREVCDTVDNDCDGLVDDDDGDVDITTGSNFYQDSDGDGWGVDSGTTTIVACAAPSGFSAEAGDCDDEDELVHPETVWYYDGDSDNYGTSDTTLVQCEQPEGYVLDGTDCDDSSDQANPAGTEVCDGLDNDCDTLVDDDDDSVDTSTYTTWYYDGDGDGYGTDDTTVDLCSAPSDYVDVGGDCEDTIDTINPGEAEISANDIDDNCDGEGNSFPTGDIDETYGDVIESGAANDFGFRVQWADINGDGSDELIAAEPGDGSTNAGMIYAWYGITSSTSSADASIEGSNGDLLGFTLTAGDFNGDKIDDVLIGAQGSDEAYLFYGNTTAVSGSYSISDAAVTFTGKSGSYFGSTVANLGDVDDDGTDDLAIGAYYAMNTQSSEGAGYLFFSSYGALSASSTVNDATQTWWGGGSYNWLGYYPQSINGLGDLDGDGVDDFAVGTDYSNGYVGGVYVTYGSASLGTGSYDIEKDEDAEFASPTSGYSRFADTIVPVGDVTGDGYDDFLVSATYDATAWVIAGMSTAYSGSYDTGSIASITFTGGTGLGWSADGGDLNSDGEQDLVISDPGATDSSFAYVGAAYAWLGPITGASYDVSTGSYSTLITNSSSEDSYAGYWVDIGDGNGDGTGDLAVGASGSSSVNGEVWLFWGGDGSF